MNSTRIEKLLDEGRREAERREAILHVRTGLPLLPEELQECERVLGSKLPAGLRQFLECWNGMIVEYYDGGRTVESENWSYRLEIADTKRIARLTCGVQDFFRIGSETRPVPVEAQQRVDGLLVLSSQDDLVIYQALDRRNEYDDCPVMQFNLEYFSDWLDGPGQPIAESVEDFVVRSLQVHLARGEDFLYWV